MAKIVGVGLVPGPKPNEIETRKLTVKLSNTFVRLTAAERRKVVRALTHFTFGESGSFSERELWSKDEAKTCYLILKPISPKMANDFRRWTAERLKTGFNFKLVSKCLMDELEVRTWIEDPESDLEG